MLEVKNLHATIAGKEILKGINLTINDGEIHAIMGPNGFDNLVERLDVALRRR